MKEEKDKNIYNNFEGIAEKNTLTNMGSNDSSPSLGSSLAGFLIVIGFIFVFAYISKVFQKKINHSKQNIKILSGISLGSKEKIVHIELNGHQFLLGVTAQSINPIYHFSSKDSNQKNDIEKNHQENQNSIHPNDGLETIKSSFFSLLEQSKNAEGQVKNESRS